MYDVHCYLSHKNKKVWWSMCEDPEQVRGETVPQRETSLFPKTYWSHSQYQKAAVLTFSSSSTGKMLQSNDILISEGISIIAGGIFNVDSAGHFRFLPDTVLLAATSVSGNYLNFNPFMATDVSVGATPLLQPEITGFLQGGHNVRKF